jgi:hypothetical protein
MTIRNTPATTSIASTVPTVVPRLDRVRSSVEPGPDQVLLGKVG